MALGVTKGPEVGRLLRRVEDWWIASDFPSESVRDMLVELVKGDA